MKRCSLFLLVCILFGAVPGAADQLKPFVLPSARASGFGGIHAAQGDDISALFSNPAAFSGINKQFSAAEITFSVYGPIFISGLMARNMKAYLDGGGLENVVDLDLGY